MLFTKSQVDRMIGTLTSKIPKTPNFVYRDELTTKKQSLPRKLQRSPKIIGYRDESLEFFSDLNQPLLPPQGYKDTEDHDQEISCCNRLSITSTNNNNNTNSNMRVKVLMTRKEAAMLLSKCKEEGTLEFKDVITELVRLPAQRINVVSDAVAPCHSTDRALATIPEED